MGVLLQQYKTVPLITTGNGKKDTKGWIVGVLSKEWPLTAREIYKRISDANSNEMTYQGVHKALKQLAEERVVGRNSAKYTISTEWVSQLGGFAEELQEALKGKRSLHLQEIAENTSVPLVFNSLIDYFYWQLQELQALPQGTEQSESYSITYHPWPITHLSKGQYLQLKDYFSKGKHYLACKGRTAYDRLLATLWKKAGRNVKLGAEGSKNADIFVIKDYVIQLFVPQKVRAEMGRIFSSRHLQEKGLVELYRLHYDKAEPVNVLITRNPSVAEQVKQEVLQEFKR